MCLDYNKINELPDNAMLKVKPELYYEWDFEKNDELGLDIWKMTKGSMKNTWWICSKCGSSFDSTIDKRSIGRRCSYCTGKKVNHTNSLASKKPELIKEWHPTRNGELTPHDFTPFSDVKVWWLGECGHEWETVIKNRTKGSNCPYCRGLLTTKENSIASTHPKLCLEWNYEKNKEIGLDIWSVSRGTPRKAWWNCNECKSVYKTSVANRCKGNGCSYCRGMKANHTNSLSTLNSELASQWHPTLNGDLTPHDVTCGSHQKAWWLCEKGHEWETKVSTRARNDGSGCPYCSGRKAWIGESDIWTTRPDMASMLLNHEDGYKHREHSEKRVDWKCPDCNHIIKNKKISDINVNGLTCGKCSDKISYPERLMFNILYYSIKDFEKQKKFGWSSDKRYDFYFELNGQSYVIETHGLQHYKDGRRGRTLKEEQENDEYKYKLAMQNGIDNYIVIDCRKSDFNWIKTNIMNSALSGIINFESLDWCDVASKSERSNTVMISEMYNKGCSKEDIGERFKLNNNMVSHYIRKGKKAGLIT